MLLHLPNFPAVQEGEKYKKIGLSFHLLIFLCASREGTDNSLHYLRLAFSKMTYKVLISILPKF